jgi:hypothetical protein
VLAVGDGGGDGLRLVVVQPRDPFSTHPGDLGRDELWRPWWAWSGSRRVLCGSAGLICGNGVDLICSGGIVGILCRSVSLICGGASGLLCGGGGVTCGGGVPCGRDASLTVP